MLLTIVNTSSLANWPAFVLQFPRRYTKVNCNVFGVICALLLNIDFGILV